MNANSGTRRPLRFLLAALGLMAAWSTPAHAQIGMAERIDDRLMVAMADGFDLDAFITAFEAGHPGLDLEPLDAVPDRGIHLLSMAIPPGEGEPYVDALELELETSWIPTPLRAAEILYTMSTPEGHTGSTYVDGMSFDAYAVQYAGGQVGAASAQARATGLGVVVAILDTGIDAAHPLLANHVVDGGYDFVDGDADASDTANGLDDDEDGLIDEMAGHGTFVSGLVTFVAPDVKLLSVRVLDDEGNGDLWALVRGLFHAIDRGVEVINLSLGSTYNSDIVEIAVDEAEALGIPTFAAAGNLNRTDPEEYPAMRDALGVTALDENDIKAEFANFSDRLFISAPGATGAMSPDQAIVSAIPGGSYGTWEGTSFAVPLCSATAALLRAQNPQWESSLQTHLQIETRMESTAFDIYPLNPLYAPDMQLGAGRLDAGAALALGPVAPELGDLDADGAISVTDLLIVLNEWGAVHSSADLDSSGKVDVADLLHVLAHWS